MDSFSMSVSPSGTTVALGGTVSMATTVCVMQAIYLHSSATATGI